MSLYPTSGAQTALSAAADPVEQKLQTLHETLQSLIGLHRQLLETVRAERDALIATDLKLIHESTLAKESVIEQIRAVDSERLRTAAELALLWRKRPTDLSLSTLILEVQVSHSKRAEQLRSNQNALQLLITRIQEQNANNQALCERTLGHLERMKKNVLGEASPMADRYSQQGQKVTGPAQARLLSREA